MLTCPLVVPVRLYLLMKSCKRCLIRWFVCKVNEVKLVYIVGPNTDVRVQFEGAAV